MQMHGKNNQKTHYQLYESPQQYGVISGRSTVLQLITILDTCAYDIDRGHHTDVIYMDFKKAFDTVPHERLISKLNSLNISKDGKLDRGFHLKQKTKVGSKW